MAINPAVGEALRPARHDHVAQIMYLYIYKGFISHTAVHLRSLLRNHRLRRTHSCSAISVSFGPQKTNTQLTCQRVRTCSKCTIGDSKCRLHAAMAVVLQICTFSLNTRLLSCASESSVLLSYQYQLG